MIEMHEAGEAQFAGRVELAQNVRERDGVGTAGHCGEDAGVAAKQVVAADELPDAIDQ